MLCQNCQQRIANVHFTQVVNNTKVEMYLCERCASDKGQYSFGSPLNISDFFPGLIGVDSLNSYMIQQQQTTCNKCGMGYEEFQKTGKMGCENCYTVYSDRLKPLIKRLHGNSEHTGKLPGSVLKGLKVSNEIEEFKEKLNSAIKSEEYEKAAELRDKIRALEADA